MKRMTKSQLIDALNEYTQFNRKELEKKLYDELLELYKELCEGGDPLFPNGRDYDAEDEDVI